MATSLLDASAILAALYEEPGCDRVHEALIAGAVMSTVNVAEVSAHLRAHDWRSGQVKDVFGRENRRHPVKSSTRESHPWR